MKKLLWIGGGAVASVIAIVVVGVIYAYSSLDGVVEVAIERFGGAATKATVTVDGGTFSPADGIGTVDGIRIGNPAGFSRNNALEFGAVSMIMNADLVAGSGAGGVLVIEEIRIAAPVLFYEIGPAGANLIVIRNNIAAYGESFAATGSAGAALVIVENLIIDGGTARYSGGMMPDSTTGPIHLKDVGKEKGGITLAEAAIRIINALIATTN